MLTTKIVGGLDPSLSNFGMALAECIYENGELIRVEPFKINLVTPQAKKLPYKNLVDLDKAKQLGKGMLDFFDMVDTIYVELPVGSQSARAMASYGICLGVIAALGSRVVRVSAKDVKLVATNNPEATKEDMIAWATEKYPKLPWLTRKLKGEMVIKKSNEHIADAIAAIHAGAREER